MKNKNEHKKISVQLLCFLVPMIAAFIIIIAAILFINSKNLITEDGRERLYQESTAYANNIGSTMGEIISYYNALGSMLEIHDYADNDEIHDALQPGMIVFDDMVYDIYLGFENKEFIDGDEWIPPEDYDTTTRGWYITGKDSDSVVLIAPYLDLDTMKIVVSCVRKVDFKDGRKAVLSADIFLDNISEKVVGYTPADTGKCMLLADSCIVASPNEGYIGSDVTDHKDDAFLQSIYSMVSSKNTDNVVNLKGNDNDNYIVSTVRVPNTDWVLVSYVREYDLLKKLSDLSIYTLVIVIVMLILSTVIIFFLVGFKITAPVKRLTNTITGITEGDFTVKIDKCGNNEIGVMNKCMYDYVSRMREMLGEMKGLTDSLSREAEKSRDVAGNMSVHADAQSSSMDQIHIAMEQIATSVTELAMLSTDLAKAVSEMMDQGNSTKTIMNELLVKAQKGQEDMTKVQSNMDTISLSMTNMNKVVRSVDSAAQKINSIVEMINSISSQTNLLSLNASIEAARAGEAGRGFAVVATEIGTLANDSASATTEIAGILNEITKQISILSEQSETSVSDIENSSVAVSDTGETFKEIFESLDCATDKFNDMFSKIGFVNNIATSVASIAENQSASTEEVTATVLTAATSAQSVAEDSRSVDKAAATVADSSSKIGKFISSFNI